MISLTACSDVTHISSLPRLPDPFQCSSIIHSFALFGHVYNIRNHTTTTAERRLGGAVVGAGAADLNCAPAGFRVLVPDCRGPIGWLGVWCDPAPKPLALNSSNETGCLFSSQRFGPIFVLPAGGQCHPNFARCRPLLTNFLLRMESQLGLGHQ